ncbi:MAG TPA: hypothetical protein VMU30_00450 [Bacteroidota bacterium]|nr:hypothetical protein [Bacteroidota bacterium]
MKKLLGCTVLMLAMAAGVAMSQGKFSGYMFGDYYYNVGRDANFLTLPGSNASPVGGQNFSAFQLRRAYLTYDNDISENFTSRFRLEADQGAGTSSTAAGDELVGGKIAPFVKDAYLTWKNVFTGSNLTFGIQPTPAYEVSEAAWGYRSLEKTIMDLRGIVDSRDLGISLRGKITDDGMVNYWLMVGNGAGTSKPEYDLYKRYYAHIQIKPTTNLQATVYADFKDAAGSVNSYTKSSINTSTMTEALFIGYSEPYSYNIGAEVFMQSASNALKDTLSKSYLSKNQMGFSVFGSVTIIPELAFVARYDNYAPSTDDNGKDPLHVTASVANANLSRNYVIAGLSWKVDKNVSIIPNVLYETYETPKNGASIDPSVTARVTMYYVFL